MKSYHIQDIIKIINDKRYNYILNHKEEPNTIEIGSALLTFIKAQFIITNNVPMENIRMIYGMEIKINDNIETPKEIKVYYRKGKTNG